MFSEIIQIQHQHVFSLDHRQLKSKFCLLLTIIYSILTKPIDKKKTSYNFSMMHLSK